MPRTLLEFFADEATDYLDRMEQTLASSDTPDADELRRFARALRGSARIADQEAIARAAGAVQTLAADLHAGQRHWEVGSRESLTSALSEIREMVRSIEAPPPDLARRAESLAQRLGEPTISSPPARNDERFKRYLGTELRGLASDIGDSLGVLERDPRNREPLKRLLRRIRPLRGIEGVDEIPSVGAAVAAVEEVILRIADTSATVGPGHVALFRRAQQALEDVATELIRGEQPSGNVSGDEIEDLKDRLLETASQREVTWISELFSDGPGPHIEECPVAERGAGSWDAFFALEATGSLDTIDRLRAELARGADGEKKIGDRLSFTFRQLRERAVTFGHADLGRVARRAGAAVRAIIDEPPARLRGLAVELATTVAALRTYLESSSRADRSDALRRAEESLRGATHPAKQPAVPIESLTYSSADALSRARELSDEAKAMLDSQAPDHRQAQLLLEEAVGLVEHALEGAGSER